MAIEREHLRPLAEEGFDLAAVSFPKVNSSGTVNVLTNFYSAPLPPGTPVAAKTYAAYVEIWQEGRCVARHERCFGRQQKVLNLEHYLDALAKKPGALAGSMALEQWRAQGRWPAAFGADYVANILRQQQCPRRPQPPLRLRDPLLNELATDPLSLLEYDAFILHPEKETDDPSRTETESTESIHHEPPTRDDPD